MLGQILMPVLLALGLFATAGTTFLIDTHALSSRASQTLAMVQRPETRDIRQTGKEDRSTHGADTTLHPR